MTSPTEPMARPMTVNDRREADAALADLGFNLASDLSAGRFSMADAVQMIEGLATRLAAIARAESPALTATCQACGEAVEGWICQGCGREFREDDAGSLVFATPRGGLGSSLRDTQPGASLTVVVPREPTEEMIHACDVVDAEMRGQGFRAAPAEAVWSAMIAAAPDAASPASQPGIGAADEPKTSPMIAATQQATDAVVTVNERPCEDCGLDWCGASCGRFPAGSINV